MSIIEVAGGFGALEYGPRGSLVEGMQGGGGGYLGRAGRVEVPALCNMGVSGRGKASGSGTSGMALGVIGLRTWTPRVSWDRLNLRYARRRKRQSSSELALKPSGGRFRWLESLWQVVRGLQ